MPAFKYLAIDDYGRKAEGILEAADDSALEKVLQGKGYYLINAITTAARGQSSQPLSQIPSFGLGKLIITLALTWFFPIMIGLWNFLFLFRDRGRRKSAIICMIIQIVTFIAF